MIYHLQIRLTEMLASEAPQLRLGASLAPISDSRICLAQLIILLLSAGDNTFVLLSNAFNSYVQYLSVMLLKVE